MTAEENKQYQKEWKRKNPEKIRQYRKGWYKRYSEKIKQSRREWYALHCEEERQDRKVRYYLNPEKVKQRVKEWIVSHPVRFKEILDKANQKRKNAWDKWIAETFVNMKECVVCGCNKSFSERLVWHHVDPASKIIIFKPNITIFSVYRYRSFNETNKILYLKEAEKCVRLCSSCHRKVHAGKVFLPAEIISKFQLEGVV